MNLYAIILALFYGEPGGLPTRYNLIRRPSPVVIRHHTTNEKSEPIWKLGVTVQSYG